MSIYTQTVVMNQAVNVLLVSYILLAINAEVKHKNINNSRNNLTSSGSSEFTDNNYNDINIDHIELKQLGRSWYKSKRKGSKFQYNEASEGINDGIINEDLKLLHPRSKNNGTYNHGIKYARKKQYKNDIKEVDSEINQNILLNESSSRIEKAAEILHKSRNESMSTLNEHLTNITDASYEQIAFEHDNNTNAEYASSDKQKVYAEHEFLASEQRPKHLDKHVMVSDNGFAYMVAIIRDLEYLSAGALIDESWVLTSADQLILMTEMIRFLRVRLGSVNYKKGGTLIPVKKIEIHPFFISDQPNYDVALIMLAKPIRLTPTIKVIRLQLLPKELMATHMIVSSWASAINPKPNKTILTTPKQVPKEINRKPFLSVKQLHPSDHEVCSMELTDFGADPVSVMCLDTGLKDACVRDPGAPVVVNGILWGVVSSWMPECDEEKPMPVFVTNTSSANVSTWIHSVVHQHKWHVTKTESLFK